MNKMAVLAESESAPRTPIPVRIIDVDVHPGAPSYESDTNQLNEWLDMADAADLLMFGSSYPYWIFDDPPTGFASVSEDIKSRIMGGNAADLYKFADRTAP